MGLDAIGIACSDTQRSITFYEALGIEFKAFGEGHYEGTTPSGLRIMLDSFELMKKINPLWLEPERSGITLCFIQRSPSQVDSLYAKLVDLGFSAQKQPWDAFWGQRYASVLDPDGNQVDLFAPLEATS